MEEIKCQMRGCNGIRKYSPTLLLYTPREYKCNDPIELRINLGICLEHKNKSTVDDFPSNEGWIQIAEGITNIGRIIPDRTRTKLRFDKYLKTLDIFSPPNAQHHS